MRADYKQRTKLITKEEIKELYDLTEYEDDRMQELTRKLMESFNITYSKLRDKIMEDKRKEDIEVKYKKLKQKYEKLEKRFKEEVEVSIKLYEENTKLKENTKEE